MANEGNRSQVTVYTNSFYNEKPFELTFFECCKHIITASEAMRKSSPNHGIHYAATYAKEGVKRNMTGKAAAIQCLYIINNLSSWRDPRANEIRARLRELSKE